MTYPLDIIQFPYKYDFFSTHSSINIQALYPLTGPSNAMAYLLGLAKPRFLTCACHHGIAIRIDEHIAHINRKNHPILDPIIGPF